MIFLAFVLMTAVAAGLPVYVHPRVDELRHADAIVILSGPHHGRYLFGFELAEQGWAPNLVVSNPSGTDNPRLTRYCDEPHARFAVHCFVPDPPTTKGEARQLQRLLPNMVGAQSSSSHFGLTYPGPGTFFANVSTVSS
jgi:hypothetical protein